MKAALGLNGMCFTSLKKLRSNIHNKNGIFHSIFGATGRGLWDLREDWVEVRETPMAVIFKVWS